MSLILNLARYAVSRCLLRHKNTNVRDAYSVGEGANQHAAGPGRVDTVIIRGQGAYAQNGP